MATDLPAAETLVPTRAAHAARAAASGGTWGTFVINETKGSWRQAKEAPGTAALNQGHLAVTNSVSCRSAGNCSAGGYYTQITADEQAFVVNETNGTWGSAEEVPGTASLNTGGFAVINSVSCGSVGHCTAGGYYTESLGGGFGQQQAFVVDQS